MARTKASVRVAQKLLSLSNVPVQKPKVVKTKPKKVDVREFRNAALTVKADIVIAFKRYLVNNNLAAFGKYPGKVTVNDMTKIGVYKFGPSMHGAHKITIDDIQSNLPGNHTIDAKITAFKNISYRVRTGSSAKTQVNVHPNLTMQITMNGFTKTIKMYHTNIIFVK